MKYKFSILSILLAGLSITAGAQEKETYYSEKFTDNIFVSAGIGAQACVNPDNFDYGIGHAITPLIHISVGKLFNPTWGTRLQVAGFWTKLYSNYGMEADTYKKVERNMGTVRIDGLFNLTNAIAGYNPDRLFTLSVFAGPGLTFAKTYGTERDKVNALVNGSVGLMGQFNINKNWDINVEARGEVSPSVFGDYSSAYTDGAVSLTVGATYTFGGKKFVSCSAKVDQAAINNEVNKYRSELAQAQTDLANTKNALSSAKQEVKEVVKEVQVAGPRAIFFKIGSSKIDDYGKVNIQLAAKVLKANPDKKYKIAGYADKATGSSSTNQKLSEKRAQAVYDAFIAEGVDAGQLELVGFGGAENMFGKDYLNRVVILE
ncbi:MAG: OmpA family protein [Bacteroides sp.]|nr:OmpA family protein [Bacteroides sp.]